MQTLEWILRDAYEVRDEVSVGRLLVQLDIALLRRRRELPPLAHGELAPLLPLLNEYTLIEFKSLAVAWEAGARAACRVALTSSRASDSPRCRAALWR